MMRTSPFPGFHTSICEVGNEKTRDGSGSFTHFPDFTPSRMGVYVAPAPARTRPHPPARICTSLPFSSREIREIREIAVRQGEKIGCLNPPGGKSGKFPPVTDTEVTG